MIDSWKHLIQSYPKIVQINQILILIYTVLYNSTHHLNSMNFICILSIKNQILINTYQYVINFGKIIVMVVPD